MIINYYRIALRNILRSKVFSLINVMGISIGMAASILILYFILFETSFDRFHKSADTIYRVELDAYRENVLENKSALTPPAVGKSLLENFPEVESYTRIAANAGKTIIVFNNKSFKEEKVYMADPSLLDVFDFEIMKGNPAELLLEPYDLIISESLAEKIVGANWQNEITLNESLTLKSQGLTGDFKVKGVFKNLPANSHFNPQILAPKSFINELVGKQASDESWDFNFFYTYIKLKPVADSKNLQAKFNAFVQDTRKESLKAANLTLDFKLLPITDIHLKSNIQFELESNGDIKTVYALALVGFIILVVAWTNFINLSTARSIKRAKEVGVRKVLGAQRKQLISQFILEAVIINGVALGIAFLIVQLSKPMFGEISGVPLAFMNLDALFSNTSLASALILLLVLGIIFSGLYPAFVLSSFNPVKALKGNLTKPGGINIRKALVVFQFSLSLIMISGTFIIYKQITFMRSTDLGINIERTIVVEMPENFDFINEGDSKGFKKAFKLEIQNLSFVNGITMSSVVPGQEVAFRSYNLENEKTKTQINSGIIGIDNDFIRNFDLELMAGKNFSDGTYDVNDVILNEEASRQLGFNTPKEAIGAKLIHQNGSRREEFIVEGVVKNYHHRSLRSAFEPILFKNSQDLQYYSIKIQPQAWDEIHNNIMLLSKQFEKYFPGNPFNYIFLDQQFDSQYKSELKFGKVFFIFSILAVVISSLGLLGLSTFMLSLRNSEIGIRKVFGASNGSITILLIKDYVNLLLISILMGIPVVWLASKEWLSNYSFKIEIGAIMLIIPVSIIMLITIFTVGFQSVHAASKNPIDSIKSE